jgi:hypothetical protein
VGFCKAVSSPREVDEKDARHLPRDQARNEGHRKQPQGAEDEEWAYMGKHE